MEICIDIITALFKVGGCNMAKCHFAWATDTETSILVLFSESKRKDTTFQEFVPMQWRLNWWVEWKLISVFKGLFLSWIQILFLIKSIVKSFGFEKVEIEREWWAYTCWIFLKAGIFGSKFAITITQITVLILNTMCIGLPVLFWNEFT